ncbi:MAG: hypothetical protein PHI68_00310 [Candidatus Cloacimonetes bacterium]|nr:hypothetical protein [Candidatus Cloacimonadota bacterium]
MLVILFINLYFLVWIYVDTNSQLIVLINISLKITLVLFVLFILLSIYKNFWSIFLVARHLDRQVEHGDDLFQNLYELSENRADSSILTNLNDSALARLQTNKYRIPAPLSRQYLILMIVVIIGSGSIWAYSWSDFKKSVKQFYTNKAEQVIYKKDIELSPGNLKTGSKEQVEIKVINPDTRLKHRLYYRYDKDWRELALTNYSYTFPALDNSIEYFVKNEVASSPVYRIEILDEPFVKKWSIHYQFPAYTGLSPVKDTLSYGIVEAYKYTLVKLLIESNIPVTKVVMNRSDGSSLAFKKIDDRIYTTEFQLLKPDTWYLEMIDELGRTSRPVEKSNSLIPDNPPEIRLLYPGEDVVLNQNLLLPLLLYADDDFGLRNCSLKFQINDKPSQSILIQGIIPTKIFEKDYIFSLKDFALFPGDVITYWVEIYDNSPDNQIALSQKYKARFPSIEEIYREIELQETARKDELRSALDKSKDLMQDFEEKRRELLKKDDLNWDDQKQLEEVLLNQENISEDVDRIAENYQNLIEKMQANEALSPETLEKMMKIQQLMEEISNEELLKAMEKFQNSLQKMNTEDLKKAMENFKFSMEDFSKKIEQTLDLLESIKKEQAVQKALQISEEMEKLQKALHEKTPDQQKSPSDLAREQQSITDKYDNLTEELKKIDQMLDSNKDQKAKQMLSDLQKQMQQSSADQDMKSSQRALEQNQRSASMQAQEQAMQKMRIFTQRLAEMKNSMGGGSAQEVMQAMQTAIRELLIFSKKHEDTAARFDKDPYQIINDIIAQYEGIQIVLNKLYSNPQTLMYIPPKFFIDLTFAYQNYRDLFTLVSDMQYYRLPELLSNIQSGLNLMIYDLMQAMQNQSSGSGGGGGMQSLIQMLEQMGQEQMAMNFLTEQLLKQMQEQGGRGDPAMQKQIQKLANDQQRLADNLKRALQNNPEAQKQGNAIQQIVEEAEAVARQLKNNQLNRDILNRQEQIISKLLDAQRSINKREFSQKRKAETAKQQEWQRKKTDLDFDALRRSAALEANSKLYPQEYQQVIIRYLKHLNELVE